MLEVSNIFYITFVYINFLLFLVDRNVVFGYGRGYPYNSTKAGGKLLGLVADYAPLTFNRQLPDGTSLTIDDSSGNISYIFSPP